MTHPDPQLAQKALYQHALKFIGLTFVGLVAITLGVWWLLHKTTPSHQVVEQEAHRLSQVIIPNLNHLYSESLQGVLHPDLLANKELDPYLHVLEKLGPYQSHQPWDSETCVSELFAFTQCTLSYQTEYQNGHAVVKLSVLMESRETVGLVNKMTLVSSVFKTP